MNNLPASDGWVFLIGGIAGIITASVAKTFSWSNYEFVSTEKERKEEKPMTLLQRLIIIAICLLLTIYGAFRIQDDRNWNPTHSPGEVVMLIAN